MENRTGLSMRLYRGCQGVFTYHLTSLWPPRPSRFQLLFLCFCLITAAVQRTWWHLSWQLLSDSTISFTHTHSHHCAVLLSLPPWENLTCATPTPTPASSSTISAVVLDAVVHNSEYTLPLSGWRVNLPWKSNLHWMENSPDPGFPRSYLDPLEGAIQWCTITETGCLGWRRIRQGSPWLTGCSEPPPPHTHTHSLSLRSLHLVFSKCFFYPFYTEMCILPSSLCPLFSSTASLTRYHETLILLTQNMAPCWLEGVYKAKSLLSIFFSTVNRAVVAHPFDYLGSNGGINLKHK